MNQKFVLRIFLFAIIYMVLSLFVEFLMIALGGLRVPEDNIQISLVLLTFVPVAAALLTGFRSPKRLFAVWLIAVVLTLVLQNIFGDIGGWTKPIVLRFIAGFIAAAISVKIQKEML